VIDQLCDDLRRLGDLDHRVGPSPVPGLSLEQRALLAQLLAGATLGQAARTLHLSRRTADRRLAAARTALGARSTAEALRIVAELGLDPARR
jgi:DNA-binding CsgD family transcriptional regulator